MKLLRHGPPGREKPGLLDGESRIRDLSAHVDDIAGEALTPEGLAQFERVAADHRALIDRLFSGLTDADLDAAKLLMRRMKEDLQ